MAAIASLALSAAVAAPAARSAPFDHHKDAMNGLVSAHAQHLSKFGTPTPGQQYHEGLYVSECEDLTGTFPEENRPLSRVATYLFNSNDGFSIDYTIYVGDSSCSPVASDVFVKEFLTGSIQYSSIPPPCSNCQQYNTGATYRVSAGDYVLPGLTRTSDVNVLNQYCGPRSCKSDWRNVGKIVHIVPSQDCANVAHPLPREAPDLCRIATGEQFYTAFRYYNGYFVGNEGSFYRNEGFNAPLNSSNHITWVQPSHNRNAQQCSNVYMTCKDYTSAAAQQCATCDRLNPDDPDSSAYTRNYLECDGCVYRAQSRPSYGLFAKCCPCFANDATKLDAPYFAHLDC